MIPISINPNPYRGKWYGISSRPLDPNERRPNKRPGVWITFRYKSLFVRERDLTARVHGKAFGHDHDLLRQAIAAEIGAFDRGPFDMTIALSSEADYERIKHLKAASVLQGFQTMLGRRNAP